tara:strand:+ start:138 stop:692 length:555 start_codon:yes stop_codon:yes gene_type:complete
MPLNYSSDVDFIDQSLSFMIEVEADNESEFALRKSELINTNKIELMLASLTVPAIGKICEAGIWKADIYNKLKTAFGVDRCIGFDAYDYLNNSDDSVTIGDFRSIHSDHNQDIALFWNGLGGWDTNGSYKQAGLDYAYNNLVSGGYYIDLIYFEGHPSLDAYPNFVDVSDDLVSNDLFRIYRMA